MTNKPPLIMWKNRVKIKINKNPKNKKNLLCLVSGVRKLFKRGKKIMEGIKLVVG